jgi:flagellar L-ring protein precursor FlgH
MMSSRSYSCEFGLALVAGLGLALGWAAEASAQSSSLYGSPSQQRSLTLPQLSWTYQAGEPKREIKLNDQITVIVDEKAQVISEGEIDRKKNANGALILKDWIHFSGGDLVPDPQSKGDPSIAGQVDNKYRANGELETREAMKLRIACRVADIRPNGTLVLEGHRMIRVNEETWEVSLGGTIRAEDVLPNNSVLSENVADLRVIKRESGHVRDGYRRGWFLQWLDTFQPF